MRKPIKEILNILRENLPQITQVYKVKTLEIFGSYVRFEEDEKSDVDILVSFYELPSLLRFIELEVYLSDKLGLNVDLVMKEALKKNIGEKILREVVMV